jgi:hypothetical protein
MELHEALAQISDIRRQLAQTETFRGYRSVTVGFSGLMALSAAALQPVWAPEPARDIAAYLTLWVGAAALCVVVTAVEMTIRCRRADSPLAVQHTRLAVEQFLPCILAGALLTTVLVLFAAETLWMLPGLWAILFSLGIFASCWLLPRPVFWIATYYLVCGIGYLALGRGQAAFSPWAMAATFGVGQLMSAITLYLTLERTDGKH